MDRAFWHLMGRLIRDEPFGIWWAVLLWTEPFGTWWIYLPSYKENFPQKKSYKEKKRRRMVLSQMEQTLKTKKEMEQRHGPSLTGCNAVAQWAHWPHVFRLFLHLCLVSSRSRLAALQLLKTEKNRGDLYPSFRVMWVALPHYLGNIHTFRHADQQRLRALCLKSEPRKHI